MKLVAMLAMQKRLGQKISRLSSFINNTIKHFPYPGEASIVTNDIYLSFYRSICVYSA